ncbi:hypothetical protein [Tropicimonas aquimaris]|uniref:Uncharacterized protein n=1 Tax=Tropicimonas aquimaris TaxID=914152 RepID=A0ABW3IWE3_9RHOB
MAKVAFTNNQSYLGRYSDLEDYQIAKFNAKDGIIRLVYDQKEAGRGFDPERSAWSVTITLSKLDTYKPDHGDYAGETLITNGKVNRIEWFDKAGKTQVKMTDIGLEAGLFHQYLREDPNKLYANLVADNSTFTGPKSANSGVDVTTGAGNDVVNAGPGGSYIKDAGGADRYIGTDSDRWDSVAYDQWNRTDQPLNRGVDVNLAKKRAVGPDGKVDKLVDIERVIGTNRKDTLSGDGDDNAFVGLRGRDVINGRGGDDRVQYYQDAGAGGYDGIVANLITGKIRDGFGTLDQVTKIEEVEGTDTDDIFIGNEVDNWFRGRDGADRFVFKGRDFGTDYVDDFSRSDGDKIEILAADRIRDLTITHQSSGTWIELNDDSKVFLVDWTADLRGSDFFF